jgi:lipopolysaccharide/colanic/teichoic acid biosynthesis glycosyltransferase
MQTNEYQYGAAAVPLSQSQEEKAFEAIVPNIRKSYLRTKRIIDVVGSAIALAVLSPIFVISAISIKFEDPKGSIIYRQYRVGKDGKAFTFYKFRSMRENSDALQESLQKETAPTSPFYKIKDDPRITRTGKFIRKYSIDELPQFWNVLKGDMSLVGPRPLQLHEAENFPEYLRNRQQVKPGLTCYWQVEERSDGVAESRMDKDIRYLRNQSLAVDAILLAKTIPAVVRGRGAA